MSGPSNLSISECIRDEAFEDTLIPGIDISYSIYTSGYKCKSQGYVPFVAIERIKKVLCSLNFKSDTIA